MSDLKPCPFCGESIQLVGSGHVHWIYCAECESRGPECDRLEDARAAWNKRPGEEALQAEAVMLREARNAWVIHSQAERRKSEAEILRLQRAHAEWQRAALSAEDARREVEAERDEARAEVERLRGGEA